MSDMENDVMLSAMMAKIKPKADEEEKESTLTELAEEKEPEAEVDAEEHETEDTIEAAEEEKPKDSDFARMRVQKDHAQKKAKEAEERLDKIEQLLATMGVTQNQVAQLLQGQQEASKTKAESKPVDQEPDINYEPEAWKEWYKRQQAAEAKTRDDKLKEVETVLYKSKVKEGLQAIESDFIEETPDYAAARDYLTKSYSNSIRMMNPSLSKFQIKAMVEEYRLNQAEQVYKQGINPAEYFYNQAKEFGYVEKEEEEQPVRREEKDSAAPNLDKLRDIKDRSKNTVTGGKNNHSGAPRKDSYSIFELASMPKAKAREVIFRDNN